MDRLLRLSVDFRGKVTSRLATAMWLLIHRPYVSASPRVRVAFGVTLRPTWSFSGRRLRIVLGRGVRIHRGVILQGGGTITIGARSYLSPYCILGSQSSISIGTDVMVAAAVSIRDTDHNFSRLDVPMNQQGATSSPVVIHDDVWIGHGAVILKGVTIGTGAIVAAQAVVTQDVPERSVVGGVPAKIISHRGSPT